MSILIKGMEMPKNCDECVMRYVDHRGYIMCELTHQLVKSGAKDRYDNCPLIELPPHGRLIDADEFENLLNKELLPILIKKYGEEEALKGMHFSFRDCICNIQSQRTVIEAEGSET